MGQVPDGGVADAYVIINAISPQYSGCLNDYSTDVDNPNICTVSFEPGQNVSDADIVAVSAGGFVSVTNESGGTVDVAVTVMGYYQNDDLAANGDTAGQTYVPVPQAQIVDTRSGLGAPQAQIPGGGSLTVQVAGNGGVQSSAAGAALFVGAANASQTGWVSAYPTGSTDSGLAMLSYAPGIKVRNLYFSALSSGGQLTLVNHGAAAVDLMVGVQGYWLRPSASPAGDSYIDVPQMRIVDTRNGTGAVPATPVPSGGSITFAATGVDGVPSAGVPAVAESVAAISPTASGYLSAYPAGGTDPNNPGVNFTAGDYQDNDIATPVLSALSPTGQETITNHSSGTVDVVVSVRGYYQAPTVPDTPNSVAWSSAGPGSATVTWLPPYTDGGSPITGYTVTAPVEGISVSVGPGATQATLTGLANPSADDYTVAATNAVGTGNGIDLGSLPGTQVSEQDIGVTVNDTGNGAPTMTLADANAVVATTNSNGVTTVTSVPADTSALTDDSAIISDIHGMALPAHPAASPSCGTTVIHNVNHVKDHIEFLGTFNDSHTQNGVDTVAWVNKLWALPNARVNVTTGQHQWQAWACTEGGGDFWQNVAPLGVGLSENALMVNSKNQQNLWDYAWPVVTKSSSSVSKTRDLSLNGGYKGATVSVGTSETVTTTQGHTEVTGSLHQDGHYGVFFMPPDIGQYYNTRVNTEWKSLGQNYDVNDEFVGSVAIAIWQFPQTSDEDHTFYSVAMLGGCVVGEGAATCANYDGAHKQTGS